MQSTVTDLQQQLQQAKDLQNRLDESQAQNEQLRAQQMATCKSRPQSKGRQELSRSPIKRRAIHSHSPPSRRRRLESRSPSARRHRQHSQHDPDRRRDDDTHRKTTLYVVRNLRGTDYQVRNLPIGAHPDDRTDWCPVTYTHRPNDDDEQPQQRTSPAGLAVVNRPPTHPDVDKTEPPTEPGTAETLPPSASRGAAVLKQNLTLEEYLHLDNDDQERPEADNARNATSTSSTAKLTTLKAEYWQWESWRQAMNAKHTRHKHELAGNLSVAQTATLDRQLTYAKTQRSHAATCTRRIQRQISQLLEHRRPRNRPQQDKNMDVDKPAEASTEPQEDQPMDTTESPQNAAEQTDSPPKRREERSDSSSS